ncbi:MAG TPA: hypothetical protein PL096_05150 [Micropepsaceae bacterium]|nr:hypothetical protein [Micropepsaceae bacterium]
MAAQIHYEIFVRKGAKSGWALMDAISSRTTAVKTAEALIAANEAAAVKVVKETYNEATGEFRSLTIFEEGTAKVRVAPEAEEEPHALPCFSPEDLYSLHSRATIGRLLADSLSRWKLTVTELIHSPEALERLEATGTVFQHAIQKVAIAQAATTEAGVAKIMKSLLELTERAIKRVYKDERAGRLVACKDAAALVAHARKVAGEPDAAYLFNAAMAKFLAPAKSWSEKLSRVAEVAHGVAENAPERPLVIASAGTIIAELLNGSAALQELIGSQPDLGSAMIVLADLFCGRRIEGASPGLAILANEFAAGRFDEARIAVGKRVVAEVRSGRKLAADLETELKHLKQIVTRLVIGAGAWLQQEDIVAAVTIRSKRYVASDTLEAWVKPAQGADGRLERLITLEENVVGPENKRALAAVMQGQLTSPQMESAFVDPRHPVDVRLKRLAAHQRRILKSNLPDLQKRQLAEGLDSLSVKAADAGKWFDVLARDAKANALMVLKLLADGAITDGVMTQRARAFTEKHLGSNPSGAATAASKDAAAASLLQAALAAIEGDGKAPAAAPQGQAKRA